MFRDQKLCEEGGGPGLSFPMPFIPLSLISHTVSVEVKHHETQKCCHGRVQELCESRGGRPGLPAPKNGICGRKQH